MVSAVTTIEPKYTNVAVELIPLRGVKHFKLRPLNRAWHLLPVLFKFSDEHSLLGEIVVKIRLAWTV